MIAFSKKNIPNLLSLLRLLSVPVLAVLLVFNLGKWALVLMVLFAISDLLDGYLARLWSATSEMGAALDPIADKFFIACLSLSFAYNGHAPLWFILLIISRDALILLGIGILSLKGRRLKIRPSFLSKLNTALQMLYLGFLTILFAFPCVAQYPYMAPFQYFFLEAQTNIEQILIPCVTLLTILSGFFYALEGLKKK